MKLIDVINLSLSHNHSRKRVGQVHNHQNCAIALGRREVFNDVHANFRPSLGRNG